MLFKDRTLNTALLISASCHLVFMLSVTPVLIPEGMRQNSTTISFLGSILKSLVTVPEKPFTLNRERVRDSSSGEFTLTPPEVASRSLDLQQDKEKILFSENKFENAPFNMHIDSYVESPMIKFKGLLVSGEAEDRVVLYKPDLYKGGVFPTEFSSDYNVSIKFKISRHGFVQSPECIESCGSSEIDEMAIRFIRRWQFVPHGDVQEGIIRVNF